MISDKYKCIFVHLPKTGGESISSKIRENDPSLDPVTIGKMKHANSSQIKSTFEDKWNNYFKFTIVRNPWDQVISMYFHLRKPLYQRKKILKQYGKTLLNPVNACRTACDSSFEDYCKIVFKDKQIQKEEHEGRFPVKYFGPFSHYILDGKDLIVDFVGRFETLRADFEKICGIIGLADFSLPHSNASDRKNYKEYYNSETRQIVADFYKDDIDQFGYSYD